jgi:riboflavin synthase
MFTGIVTAIGTVEESRQWAKIKPFHHPIAPYEAAGIDLGASIAHDGCCLTVTSLEQTPVMARATPLMHRVETLRLTTLGKWAGRHPDQSGALAQAGR